jgi:hypothetical protein
MKVDVSEERIGNVNYVHCSSGFNDSVLKSMILNIRRFLAFILGN